MGNYLYKFDIQKGYHHIEINSEHQTYLGFKWYFKGIERYFIFLVLPFGITSGPFVFTKVMRVLVKYWRSLGIKIGCFLDDGLGIGSSYEIAKKEADVVRLSLISAGFLINDEKSLWLPTTCITWLGITFDSEKFMFSISEKRCHSLLDSIDNLLKKPRFTSARKIARVVGKILSTMFVLRDIVQIKTRRLYSVINENACWDSNISLLDHTELIQELEFWKNNFMSLNVRYLSKVYSPPIKGTSDASDTGLAAKILIDGNNYDVYKNFSIDEGKKIQHGVSRMRYIILCYLWFLMLNGKLIVLLPR